MVAEHFKVIAEILPDDRQPRFGWSLTTSRTILVQVLVGDAAAAIPRTNPQRNNVGGYAAHVILVYRHEEDHRWMRNELLDMNG